MFDLLPQNCSIYKLVLLVYKLIQKKFMKKKFINVCYSDGNPLDPKIWSATPYNICKALESKNSLGKAFSSDFEPKFELFFFKLLSKIYYLNSKGIFRGSLCRFGRALNVKKRLSSQNVSNSSSPVLHVGTLDMPVLAKDEKQNHYLFCDSTWNLWSKNSTEMNGYSKRLINDAERLEVKSYAQSHHIFSISEYVKDNLINHYGVNEKKITVVGTGRGIINPYFGKKDYNNGKILFAAKGRFADKGGDLALKAFELAHAKNSNLQLTIVGQNEYTGKIDKSNVKTLGFVTKEELQELFNSHSLFLMPAINEPWGLVYLEALSCKMPIIGLNRNSFPELSGYGKHGYILNSNDENALAELLLRITNSSTELEEKGLTGQKFCLDNFTWDNVAGKILNTIYPDFKE